MKYAWKTWDCMQGTCLYLKQSVHLLNTSLTTVNNAWSPRLTIQVAIKDQGPAKAGIG